MAIVTISRGSKSGGQALAACVAAALGAPSVGREILIEAAANAGVSEEVLRRKLESSPGLWDRVRLERRVYVAAMQVALAERAASGSVVYNGYVGHLLLRGLPAVLRVRLIAPMAGRLKAAMDELHCGSDEAARHIRKVDEQRSAWVRAMYDVDPNDASLYDLVINLERMSVSSACAIVVAAAGRPEFQVSPDARAKLSDYVLAARVKLALAVTPATRGVELEVTSRDGVVTLSGEVPKPMWATHTSARWEQELRTIAGGIEGVADVVLEVDAVDAYH